MTDSELYADSNHYSKNMKILGISTFYSVLNQVCGHFVNKQQIGTHGDPVNDIADAMHNSKIHSGFSHSFLVFIILFGVHISDQNFMSPREKDP